jgi:hypothetical protein
MTWNMSYICFRIENYFRGGKDSYSFESKAFNNTFLLEIVS